MLVNNKEHFQKLIYCTFFVMLCFTIQNSGKSISYNVYNNINKDYIYPLQFTISYFISPLVLLFMDAILQKLKIGLVLYLGIFNCFSFLFGALLVVSCYDDNSGFQCQTIFLVVTICLETLIGGICACLFYVGFAVYLNSISNENNKSIYIGIGYSIFSASGLFGNMTGYFVSQTIDPFNYYLILICLLSLVQLSLLFIKDIRKIDKSQQKSFMALTKESFYQIKDSFQHRQFLIFVPLMISIAIIYGSYFNLLPSLLKYIQGGVTVDQHTFIMYFISGLGSIVGGFLCGLVIRKTTIFTGAYTFLLLAILFCACTVISMWLMNLYVAYLGGFFVGCFMSGTNSLQVTIISKMISQKNQYFVANNICTVFIMKYYRIQEQPSHLVYIWDQIHWITGQKQFSSLYKGFYQEQVWSMPNYVGKEWIRLRMHIQFKRMNTSIIEFMLQLKSLPISYQIDLETFYIKRFEKSYISRVFRTSHQSQRKHYKRINKETNELNQYSSYKFEELAQINGDKSKYSYFSYYRRGRSAESQEEGFVNKRTQQILLALPFVCVQQNKRVALRKLWRAAINAIRAAMRYKKFKYEDLMQLLSALPQRRKMNTPQSPRGWSPSKRRRASIRDGNLQIQNFGQFVTQLENKKIEKENTSKEKYGNLHKSQQYLEFQQQNKRITRIISQKTRASSVVTMPTIKSRNNNSIQNREDRSSTTRAGLLRKIRTLKYN